MNGIRFYLEYPSSAKRRKGTRKKLGEHSGTVLAVYYGLYRIQDDMIITDCIGTYIDKPDASVVPTSVSDGYLAKNCLRISEETAREIHPQLFQVLDSQEAT